MHGRHSGEGTEMTRDNEKSPHEHLCLSGAVAMGSGVADVPDACRSPIFFLDYPV